MTTEIDELWAEIEAFFPVDTADKQLNLANANKIIGLREVKPALNKWAVAKIELARMNELDRLEYQLLKAHGRLSEFETQYLTKRRAELEGMK